MPSHLLFHKGDRMFFWSHQDRLEIFISILILDLFNPSLMDNIFISTIPNCGHLFISPIFHTKYLFLKNVSPPPYSNGRPYTTCESNGSMDLFLKAFQSLSGADLGILRGGGGVLGRNSSKGGGVRVQVHVNFHILTSKKKNSEGGGG